jgi:lysophospholipase L1-like esterase
VAENMASRSLGDHAFEPLHLGDVMFGLGDSIAAGIGAAHVTEGCLWLLAGQLRRLRPNLEFQHLAIPSESTTSMLRPGGQMERAEQGILDAVQRGLSIGPVALSIGGNDAMEAGLIGEDETLARMESQLEQILRRLDAALRTGGQRIAECVAVQTIYNPFEEVPADSADVMAPQRASRTGYSAAIRRVAQNMGVRVVDVSSLFRDRCLELTWVRTGDIHPTGDGHALIADEYLRVGGWSAA